MPDVQHTQHRNQFYNLGRKAYKNIFLNKSSFRFDILILFPSKLEFFNESEVGLGRPGRDADLHLSVGDFIIVLSPPF